MDKVIQEICANRPEMFETYSLSQLADYFRGRESVQALTPMLTHKDPEIASAGAWIASEVIEENKGREIFFELAKLLGHPDPGVRFWPISSVALLAKDGDTKELKQLLALLGDENPGVRNQAMRSVRLLSNSTLSGIKDLDSVCYLFPDVPKKDYLEACRSPHFFIRRIAIAGVMHNFSGDKEFIREMCELPDQGEREEVRSLA